MAFLSLICNNPGMLIDKRMDFSHSSGYSRRFCSVPGQDPFGLIARAPTLGQVDGHPPLSWLSASGGVRYIVSYEDFWLGLAAWQNGAFKCAPRDRWVGWKPK